MAFIGPSLLSFPVALIHFKAHQTSAFKGNKDKITLTWETIKSLSLMINPTSFQATLLYNQ